MYWAFYYLYSELFEDILPNDKRFSFVREQFRILLSGFSASITAVFLSNPLDVVRTRYQLQVRTYFQIGQNLYMLVLAVP